MDPTDWKYLAEGGANIVFRYEGLLDEFKNKVLRIRKGSSHSNQTLIPLLPQFSDFICKILGLNGSIGTISCIKVSQEFLETLNQNSFLKRPENRRSKAEIDTSLKIALLLPDLLCDYFSCEIKPKWSGLKHHHSVFDICKCRYCLAQISKGRRDANQSSIYCPKFLFSDQETQINLALTDLFENPSNQFKLFVDSVMIGSSHSSEFRGHLIPILVKIFANDPIFQNFIKFQFQLLEGIVLDLMECSRSYEVDLENLCSFSNISEIPDYLRILMTMSLRDSSFVISLCPFQRDSIWKSILVSDQAYYYRIDIIDLDIKPIEKLDKYVEEIKTHG